MEDTSNWSQYSHEYTCDLNEDPSSSPAKAVIIDDLPPQLHPAVSLGMRRVSSCYFSIAESDRNNSMADLLSLLQEEEPCEASSSVLYHDILMQVFGFLDQDSLRAFSETSRHSNFECFYFLQLRLQQAMLEAPCALENDEKALANLAQLDRPAAEEILTAYLESNTTLTTMPLSHSIAYMRQWLQHKSANTAQAAALMVLLGGATMLNPEKATELLPQVIFRVGFVGSLMGAARTMTDEKERNALAKSMQIAETRILEQMEKVMPFPKFAQSLPQEQGQEMEETKQDPPSPYEHMQEAAQLPSGCVGAYAKAIATANQAVRKHLKERRKRNFQAIPQEQRPDIASLFIDACSSDESISQVQTALLEKENIDVDGFYLGSDGTETCALHASAFHGATLIVEFLCKQGLADVNMADQNGWTALHFAAGANSVKALRTLCQNGARLDLEATNGYTPLQWAERLQNTAVAEELKRWSATKASKQSSIASRFLALIPTSASGIVKG